MKDSDKCKKCGGVLDYLNKSGYCKECYPSTEEFKIKQKEYSDRNYKKNKKEILTRAKDYREKTGYNKKYYEKNKKKINKKAMERYWKNKEVKNGN